MASPLATLALNAYRQGRLDEAADHCRAILRAAPDDLGALQMLGAIGALLLQQGRAADALAPLEQALARQPRNAALHNSRAGALQALGRKAEAVAAYDKALAAGEAHPEALLQRGHLLMALGRPDLALASYERSLAARGDIARGEFARGNALLALGRAADAAESFRKALAAAPNDRQAANNLAIACQHLGRDDEALALYDGLLAAALQDDPVFFGRAQLHLAHGRFAAGWADYRARHSAREHRALLFQDRLAASLAGETLWLRQDQGLGDEIFFLRFAAELKRRGARLVYQASAKLAPLIARAGIVDEVLAHDAPIPTDARVLSIGDLPYALGHDAAAPASIALAPLAERAQRMAARLAEAGPPPYIGVTWRAGTREHAGLSKEAPLPAIAASLGGKPGTLLSLQRLPEPGETAAFAKAAGKRVADFSAVNDDLEDALALLSLLDDYIAVSNTNVHLRLAAGRASRILVPMPAEWRWMASGERSPWFPGHPLYRQAADGDWKAALRALAGDLESVLKPQGS